MSAIDAATPDSSLAADAAQPSPDAPSTPADAPTGTRCAALALVGDDGTYLGDATSSSVDANSVCNAFGLYGSSTGLFSIYNPNGLYGSSFALYSAYNPYTISPPHLACVATGAHLNHVTKNAFLADVFVLLDPDLLCSTLAANGY